MLASRSEVFDKMFETAEMAEAKSKEVIIEDVDEDVMEIFLRILYTEGAGMPLDFGLEQSFDLLQVRTT